MLVSKGYIYMFGHIIIDCSQCGTTAALSDNKYAKTTFRQLSNYAVKLTRVEALTFYPRTHQITPTPVLAWRPSDIDVCIWKIFKCFRPVVPSSRAQLCFLEESMFLCIGPGTVVPDVIHWYEHICDVPENWSFRIAIACQS